MGRVRALPSSLLEYPDLLQLGQQRIQQQRFGSTLQQAPTEFTEHAEVEARMGELQSESILPVNPAANRFGGLPVGEPLDKLQYQNQGESGRRPAGLAARGE
jgi:hypothetical protein